MACSIAPSSTSSTSSIRSRAPTSSAASRLSHRDAVRDRAGAELGRSPFERTVDRGIARRLNADHFDRRLQRFGRDRDAGDQPATPDRHDERVQSRLGCKHLERDRSLAGDDALIVVGVYELEPQAGREVGRMRAGFVETLSREKNFRPECACALHFDGRREARHHDDRGNAEPARVIRHALRMVAGGGGDDTFGALRLRQRRELHERAAFLERRRELQVLELEPHACSDDFGNRARQQTGRVDDMPFQDFGCRPDVLQANHRAPEPNQGRQRRSRRTAPDSGRVVSDVNLQRMRREWRSIEDAGALRWLRS